MSSLTFLLLFLCAWVPCALWVGRSGWQEARNATLLERVAGTFWVATLGGLGLVVVGVFAVGLVAVIVSAIV